MWVDLRESSNLPDPASFSSIALKDFLLRGYIKTCLGRYSKMINLFSSESKSMQYLDQGVQTKEDREVRTSFERMITVSLLYESCMVAGKARVKYGRLIYRIKWENKTGLLWLGNSEVSAYKRNCLSSSNSHARPLNCYSHSHFCGTLNCLSSFHPIGSVHSWPDSHFNKSCHPLLDHSTTSNGYSFSSVFKRY